MKKILGICSSPRGKSGTEYALSKALEAAEQHGVETRTFTLRGKRIGFCIHCDKCMREGTVYCPVNKDDLEEFYPLFTEADGYLFASPVYEMSVNGQMSVLMDRTRPVGNLMKKEAAFFYHKFGGAIAVGGARNGGQEKAVARIHDFFLTLGITPVGPGTSGYSGATLWSDNGSYETLTHDSIGLGDAERLGIRVAEMVRTRSKSKQ